MKALFFAVLISVALSGCAIPMGGAQNQQNAMQFADQQGQQMKLHGGSFMRNALDTDLCTKGSIDEKSETRKDAYINNNSGGVDFGISYSGRGRATCK